MKQYDKHQKIDHQIFDGGRPEFRNINERIFAALESEEAVPYSDANSNEDPYSRQQTSAGQTALGDAADISPADMPQREDDPPIYPL